MRPSSSETERPINHVRIVLGINFKLDKNITERAKNDPVRGLNPALRGYDNVPEAKAPIRPASHMICALPRNPRVYTQPMGYHVNICLSHLS